MNNTPDSPAKPPDDRMDQGGNYWTLFTPGIWKVLHAVLHDSYPRAIRTTLGAGVRHRDSQYLNNRLEQDHRGVKGRYGPMRGFKCPRSASEFCRAYDELRNFLRSRSRTNQQVSANYRRFHFLRRTAMVLSVLKAA
jgi:putative transposase